MVSHRFASQMMERIDNHEEAVCYFFETLAKNLLLLGSGLEGSGNFLLGGSLARGEPCIPHNGSELRLLSDYDFLQVYDQKVHRLGVVNFKNAARIHLDGVISFFSLSTAQYSRLQTSIGYDYKSSGISITQETLSNATLPTLTQRDCADILVFAIQEYFESSISECCVSVDSGNVNAGDLDYLLHRLFINALRSVVMLEGGYYYHDVVRIRHPELRLYAKDHLDWRDGKQTSFRPSLPHCLLSLAWALQVHIHSGYLRFHMNTVDGTEYAQNPGSAIVKHIQQIILELWSKMLVLLEPDLGRCSSVDVLRAEQTAWHAVSRDHGIEGSNYLYPSRWLRQQKRQFREALLSMKVAEDIS